MTDCRPSWIHHLAILVIWRGLAPPTPAHRLMTPYPPPEIVTYHLDKLSAPTESHGVLLSCCLGRTRWLSKLPDCCQTSDRQAAMSPKHPDHPPCLPLDHEHHPILSLSLTMSALFWLAVHCFVSLPFSHSCHLLGAPSALPDPTSQAFQGPDCCLVIHPDPWTDLPSFHLCDTGRPA